MNIPPIPGLMSHLQRDKRGLPIPYIVLRDVKGEPHFTINDSKLVDRCKTYKLCSICGGKLGVHVWFIGGPMSAFHPNGAYIDPPVHKECGDFALRTCPYIALPSWSETKRLDGRTLKPENVPPGVALVTDPTMIPERPPVFVFADCRGYMLVPGSGHMFPERPWRDIQYWRHGVQIPEGDALAIMKEHYQ